MKGAYILIIKLGKNSAIGIGALGKIKFRKGFYAYAGSGMNSLEKRVERHSKKRGKKTFWHVDYLLRKAKLSKALVFESSSRRECEISAALSARFEGVRGFGCSDCTCESHLFHSERLENLEKAASKINRSFRALPLPLRRP